MESSSVIAQNLERLLGEKNTTARALAERAGLGHTAARDIIIGKTKSPTMRVLRKLADCLGVPVSEITGLGVAQDRVLTPAEHEILRLTGLLSDAHRQQLLGYAAALAAEPGQALRSVPEAHK